MKRFVMEFGEDYQSKLANEINKYAEENNLTILQISYSALDIYKGSDKALVLFERSEGI